MSAFQRVTTFFHDRRTPDGMGSRPTRLVIPGPFMMGWVVDVPRGAGSSRGIPAGARHE